MKDIWTEEDVGRLRRFMRESGSNDRALFKQCKAWVNERKKSQTREVRNVVDPKDKPFGMGDFGGHFDFENELDTVVQNQTDQNGTECLLCHDALEDAQVIDVSPCKFEPHSDEQADSLSKKSALLECLQCN